MLVRAGAMSWGRARQARERERPGAALEGSTDFAERIREGTATLEYAESVTVETGVRIESWAEKLREALRMLGPMAGHPFPPNWRSASR